MGGSRPLILTMRDAREGELKMKNPNTPPPFP